MHFTRRSAIVGGARLAALGLGSPRATGPAFPVNPQPAHPPKTRSLSLTNSTWPGSARPSIQKTSPTKPPPAPRIKHGLREFIYFAHSNIDVIRDMLAEQPKLVTAAWDWGGGDWETALGAASHMGRRDIAELLLLQRMPVSTSLPRQCSPNSTSSRPPSPRSGRHQHPRPAILHPAHCPRQEGRRAAQSEVLKVSSGAQAATERVGPATRGIAF